MPFERHPWRSPSLAFLIVHHKVPNGLRQTGTSQPSQSQSLRVTWKAFHRLLGDKASRPIFLVTFFSFQCCSAISVAILFGQWRGIGGIACSLNWNLYASTVDNSMTNYSRWFLIMASIVLSVCSISLDHGTRAAAVVDVFLLIDYPFQSQCPYSIAPMLDSQQRKSGQLSPK